MKPALGQRARPRRAARRCDGKPRARRPRAAGRHGASSTRCSRSSEQGRRRLVTAQDRRLDGGRRTARPRSTPSQNATATLARDNTYQDATAKLAGDALARAYANGDGERSSCSRRRLADDAAAAPGAAAVAPQAFQWGARGRRRGERRLGRPARSTRRRGATAATTRVAGAAVHGAALLDEIPAGALFVADFQVTPAARARRPASLPKPIQQLLHGAASAPGQLDAIFGGETALYVRPGAADPGGDARDAAGRHAGRGGRSGDSVVSALTGAAAGAGGRWARSATCQLYRRGRRRRARRLDLAAGDRRLPGRRPEARPPTRRSRTRSSRPRHAGSRRRASCTSNLEATLPLVAGRSPRSTGATLPPAVQGADLAPLQTLTAFARPDAATISSFTVFLGSSSASG